MRMVVDTDTGIEGEPVADVLPKIDITGYFVLYFIDDVFKIGRASCRERV